MKGIRKNDENQSAMSRKFNDSATNAPGTPVSVYNPITKNKDILDVLEEIKTYCEYHTRFPVVFNPVGAPNSA